MSQSLFHMNEAESPLPNTEITRIMLGGRYKLIKPLGGGGYGQTYLAEDCHLPNNPYCVVKKLQPQTQDEYSLKVARRLFNTEAEVLYKLGSHSQIPRLFAHFEQDNEFYLVQEYIDGIDLSQDFSSGRLWDEEKVIRFLQEVLPVLSFVHQQKVIHRDLKPANIIRRKSDQKFFLIDFGAVKQVSSQMFKAEKELAETVAIGTQGYMPIEQSHGNPHFCSDLYALGIICIQALTGLHPSRNQFPKDPLTGEITWQNRGRVSPHLARVLDRMVRHSYKDRYSTVDAVLKDLPTPISSGNVVNEVVSGSETTPLLPEIVVLPQNKPRLRFSAIFLAIGIAIASGGYFLRQSFLAAKPSAELTSQPILHPSASIPSVSLTESESQELQNLLAEGNRFQEEGNYTQALVSYEKALKINLYDPEVSAQRCYILNSLQRYDYAVQSCDHVLQIAPQNYKAWWNKGLALSGLQQYEEALQAYEQALAIKPDFPEALSNQGATLHRLQRYEEAISAYNQALEIRPKMPESWNNRGVSLNRLGRHNEALASFEQALNLKTDYPEAWNNRGNALLNLNSHSDALASYEKALQLKPDYQPALENRERLKTRSLF